MSETLCLYCKAPNRTNEEICAVCGMPLSMSRPEEVLDDAQSGEPGSTGEAYTTRRTRAEIVEEIKQAKDTRQRARIYVAVGITIVICLVGIVLQQSRSSVEESKPEDTRIILDQKVGVPSEETTNSPDQLNSPEQGNSSEVNSHYAAAQKALKEGRLDEAEDQLQMIPESDKDYPKVWQLRRAIESKRQNRDQGSGARDQKN